MHYAPSNSLDMPGYFLPEDMYSLLRDVSDELQLMVALTATTDALDGKVVSMRFKRAALAGYLRGVHERIENALHPVELSVKDDKDETP